MNILKTTTTAPKAKPLSKRAAAKAKEEDRIKQMLKAEAEGKRRVDAEAAELAKLSPTELVKRWDENEKKMHRSRHRGNIYHASWQTLCRRSSLLEDLIARKQTSPEGLVAKLYFLDRQIDVDDAYSRELAASCRMDAENILNISPF